MKHIKYPKIQNYYRERFITDVLAEYPYAKHISYIVEEKLHGTNFAVYIRCNGRECNVNFATRNQILRENSDFYGWQKLLETEDFQQFLYNAQKFLMQSGLSYIFYGEMMGYGIQRGVDYGVNKAWRVFDIFSITNNRMLSPEETIMFLKMIDSENIHVPIVAIVPGLEEAVSIDTRFPTKLNPKEGNICEGVVIKPYRHVLYDSHRQIFYLKKKNKEYKEVAKVESKKRFDTRTDTRFDGFANENRIASAESKIGKFEDLSQINTFLKEIMPDIYKDLKEEPEFIKLPKEARKFVMKRLSYLIVEQLKSKLK